MTCLVLDHFYQSPSLFCRGRNAREIGCQGVQERQNALARRTHSSPSRRRMRGKYAYIRALHPCIKVTVRRSRRPTDCLLGGDWIRHQPPVAMVDQWPIGPPFLHQMLLDRHRPERAATSWAMPFSDPCRLCLDRKTTCAHESSLNNCQNTFLCW
jgi:hypothetical protein